MGLEVAGWFASAVIGKLVDQVRSYIGGQYGYQTTNTKDKLEKLEGNMTVILAAIHEAERRGVENPIQDKWLRDLKDACQDAEDVLDSFEYQLLKDKANGGNQMRSVSATAKKTFKDASTVAKRFLFRDEKLNELLEVVDRFDKLVNQMPVFLQLLSFSHAPREKEGESCEIADWRMTDSDFTEPQLFGRQKERTHLIKQLLENGGNEGGSRRKVVHVLPIVGLGGIGKTTLAQSVYNEEKVKQSFDLAAWVCVSNKFELKRLMTEIIESACIQKPSDFHNIKSLDRIRQILKNGLTGKRFLIVLDDVWDEELWKWDKLRSALEFGEEGSKIIVTTRNYKIAHMMGTKEATITLESLAYDECWDFFAQCAFGDEKPENHRNLEFIGQKIVKKLGGLPLAAKVIGALLRSELKEHHWKEVSESKLWQIDEHEGGVMSALRLSYKYLPPHLKQCFIYCSLFPKDYRFSEEKLVRLWMAQGFIHPNQEKSLEMIGMSYFDELLNRSFFQKAGHKGYVIHDLLHDLAESLSDGESFRAEGTLLVEIPMKARHVYISANNLPAVCNNKYAKKHMRSLVVVGGCHIKLEILKELKGLRVLILDQLNMKLCSESFRQMLHLRYLEIVKCWYQGYFELPESLCKLYHLQVLSLGTNWQRTTFLEWPKLCLPKVIIRLIKLHHLFAYAGEVAGIGTLTCLQELSFRVKQKERGFEIGQLGGMLQLRKLHIEGLESVESKEQASGAKLCDKRSLEELRLKWDSESHVTNNPDEEVLEGMEPPHQNLEHLVIEGYRGNKCPSWWNGNCVSSYLKTIELRDCSNLEILPPMGQLPFLEVLELRGMNGVKRIGPEFYGSKAFPSLLRLEIDGMPELTEWCSRVEGLELFPRLSKLTVNKCPKLRGPLCLPSHSQPRILCFDITEEPPCIDLDMHSDGRAILRVLGPNASRLKEWFPWQNLSSVEEVYFTDEKMTSFPSEELEEWFQHLTTLRSLCFYICSKLQSLPSKLINSLPALQELSLVACCKIKSLPEEGLPRSLTKLKIKFSFNLQSLPSNLINSLPALQELTLYFCNEIKSLPEEGLPRSLTKLEIWECSRELAERCEKHGVDWHKISHIPTIQIMKKDNEEVHSIASTADYS